MSYEGTETSIAEEGQQFLGVSKIFNGMCSSKLPRQFQRPVTAPARSWVLDHNHYSKQYSYTWATPAFQNIPEYKSGATEGGSLRQSCRPDRHNGSVQPS